MPDVRTMSICDRVKAVERGRDTAQLLRLLLALLSTHRFRPLRRSSPLLPENTALWWIACSDIGYTEVRTSDDAQLRPHAIRQKAVSG